MKKKVTFHNIVLKHLGQNLLLALTNGLFDLIKNQEVPGNKNSEIKCYILHKLKLKYITINKVENIPVLFGQLVKNQEIEAQQEWSEQKNKIIPSDESMKSAPTSLFAINLKDHKLIYIPETKRAPQVTELKTTLHKILAKERSRLVKLERLKLDKEGRYTKKEIDAQLASKYPLPVVRIEALKDNNALLNKISQLEKIKELALTPEQTNNEIADEDDNFINSLAQKSKKTNATSVKLTMKNGRDGLDKQEVLNLAKVTSDGNYKLSISGIQDNQDIKIDNDSCKASVDIDYQKDSPETNVAIGFAKMWELLKTLQIKFGKIPDKEKKENEEMINEIMN